MGARSDAGMPALRAITLAGVLCASSGAAAFDTVDLQRLADTGKCAGCDLSGADLQGRDLTNADLSGTDLSKAKLQGAKLRGAVLIGTDLNGADLSGAFISGAYIRSTRMCRTIMPDRRISRQGC